MVEINQTIGGKEIEVELIILTCLQAQILSGKVYSKESLSLKDKNDLVWEIKQVAPKDCKIYDKRTENSNQSTAGGFTYPAL